MKRIMQAVKERSPLNEIVRLQETVGNNHRMTIHGAYARWSSNLQVCSLLEVLMETVHRVDDIEDALEDSDVAATIPELSGLATTAQLDALMARIDELEKKLANMIGETPKSISFEADTIPEAAKPKRTPAQPRKVK